MPKKRLRDLVRDKSFLARRHEGLLAGESLSPVWGAELVELQERFRAEADPFLRRRVSLRFERVVRETEAERFDRVLDEVLSERPAVAASGRAGGRLLERVLGNSFRAARDGSLLAAESLPAVCPLAADAGVWQELRATQDRYRLVDQYPGYAAAQYEASAEQVRRLYSSEFATLVESLHAGQRPARLRTDEYH